MESVQRTLYYLVDTLYQMTNIDLYKWKISKKFLFRKSDHNITKGGKES